MMKEARRFWLKIKKELNLKEWDMKWTPCSAGLCNRRTKVIYIPERLKNSAEFSKKEYILHEVTHILTKDIHGRKFYFIKL